MNPAIKDLAIVIIGLLLLIIGLRNIIISDVESEIKDKGHRATFLYDSCGHNM